MTAQDMMRPKRGARITYYKDRDGSWRWKLQAANFEIVSSGEGYKTFNAVNRGYKAMVKAIMEAREIVVDD